MFELDNRLELDKAKRLEARDRMDFKAVASTIEGRRVLGRLLSECAAENSAFSSDALDMARRCGKHEIAQFIKHLFWDCDHLRVLMIKEAAADSESFGVDDE